jgi:NTP pyrophosphatase (non-canonical NTP hydrolase)
MNIAALQATLRQFAADRHWQPFQTPKNLAMALVVEAAELVEIFQWMTAEQSQLAHRDAAVKQHIGEEIADVLVYLLQIADHNHIDVQRAVDAKLVLNARKYPPVRPAAALQPAPVSADAEAQASPPVLGRTHVLLDFENVQPDAQALRALVPDLAQVWLFHGPQQKDPGKRLAGLPVTLVPISKTGKNALDFHLTFYVGYIMSRHPDDKIVVVANDRGYEPMLMHARSMGFDVRLQTHVPAKRTAAAKRAPAAKKVAPARKMPAAKPVAPPVPAPAAKAPTRTRAKAGAAAPTPVKPVAAKNAVVEKPVTAKKVVARKAAVKKVAAAKPAVAPAPAVAAAPRPPVKPQEQPQVKPQVKPQKLLENLRKMGEQRPTSRAPLVRVLQSYMGSGATLAAAEVALDQLAAAGFLTVTPAGRVRYAL